MIRLLWFILSAAAAVFFALPAFQVMETQLAAFTAAPLPSDPIVQLGAGIACGAVILALLGFVIPALLDAILVSAARRRLTRALEETGPGNPVTESLFRDIFTSLFFLDSRAEQAGGHLVPVPHDATNLRAGQTSDVKAVETLLPSRRFFGPDRIVDNRLALWFYRVLPALLWSAGCLGAVLVFTQASGIRLSWAALVAAAAWAFALPAAAGTLLSLLIRVIAGWRHAQAADLCDRLDMLLGYSPENRRLHDLLDRTEAQTRSLETAFSSLGVAIEQTTVKDSRARSHVIDQAARQLGESLRADLESALKDPLAELAKASIQLSEDQSAQVQQVLRTTLKSFVSEVQGLVGQQISAIHNALKDTSDIAHKLERSLGDSARTLSKFSKTQTADMTEALNQYRATLTAFEEKMRQDLGADFKDIAEKFETSATAFNAANAGVNALGESLQPLLSDLLNNQKNLRAAIESQSASSDAIRQAAHDISRLAGKSPLPQEVGTSRPPSLSEDFRKLKSLTDTVKLPEL